MRAVVRALLIGVLTLLIVFVVGFVLYAIFVPGADEPAAARVQPATSRITIVAMGDSYMSGEGAGTFYRGTDRPRGNKCRRAPSAYPVRVADALEARLFFAACSGARTFNVGSRFSAPDVIPTPQYPGVGLQIRTLEKHPNADVVLLSLGGNDALFADVVARCAGRAGSCVRKAATWMDNLDEVVQPVLRDVYAEVRENSGPAAHIFITTYPSPFGASVTSCDDVGMDSDEVRFVRTFLNRLNDQTRLAAADAGFGIIDLQSVLADDGLCSNSGDPVTLNGWRVQKPDGFPSSPMDLVRGSFHPTEHGHELMAATVLQRVREAMERARSTAPDAPPDGPPTRPPEMPPPGVPPTLPPYLPDEYGPPVAPYPQERNPCTTIASKREIVELSGGPDHITRARPRSRICFRTYHGEWHTTRADDAGRATVPFPGAVSKGIGGYRRVLYRDSSGAWVQRVLVPGSTASPPEISIAAAWLTGRSLFVGLVALAALFATVVGAFVAARAIVSLMLSAGTSVRRRQWPCDRVDRPRR